MLSRMQKRKLARFMREIRIALYLLVIAIVLRIILDVVVL